MKQKRTVKSVSRQIGQFFREHRRMPSYAEMVNLLGVRSKSVVDYWVNKLIDAELLEKDQMGRLALTKRSFAIPMVGSVQAGIPSMEEEIVSDVVSMDEYLVTRPETSFLLQVTGDSMIEAGIMEGDLAIVEKDRDPTTGDIVIAEVDGEWTIKYFVRKGDDVVLEAANPKYSDIHPRRELRIGGVVTAVIRKYHT